MLICSDVRIDTSVIHVFHILSRLNYNIIQEIVYIDKGFGTGLPIASALSL